MPQFDIVSALPYYINLEFEDRCWMRVWGRPDFYKIIGKRGQKGIFLEEGKYELTDGIYFENVQKR